MKHVILGVFALLGVIAVGFAQVNPPIEASNPEASPVEAGRLEDSTSHLDSTSHFSCSDSTAHCDSTSHVLPCCGWQCCS